MEKLIVPLCLAAGASLIALFALGTRIFLKMTGPRLTVKRLLPWLLWVAAVTVAALLTVLVAVEGFSADGARSRAFIRATRAERIPEAAPAPRIAPETEAEVKAEEEEEAGEDAYEPKGDPPRSANPPASRDGRTAAPSGGNADPALAAPHESLHRAYLLGYKGGVFRPEAGISRAEMTVMFAGLLAEPGKNGTESGRFRDVPSGSPYADTLGGMVLRGVVTGYPEGDFRPDAPVSRAEFVSVCLRLADNASPAESPLAARDGTGGERILRFVPKPHWARPAVEEVLSRGWLDLCESDGPDFFPDAHITRAEAATIVNRMLGRAADLSFILSRTPSPFRDVPRDFWAFSDISEASVDHSFVIVDGAELWSSLR